MTPDVTRTRGFSLTELLVAMVIGLLLLGGLVTLMVNSKKNYAQQDYSARLQENARFAVDFLSHDIRMAGFYGCGNNIINDNTITPITATNSGDGNPDSITINYGAAYRNGQDVVLVGSNVPPEGTTLAVSEIPGEWDDTAPNTDSLVIADCGSAAIADIDVDGIDDSTSPPTVTVTPRNGSFGRVFNPAADGNGPITVRKLVSNTYAIVSSGGSGIPVLTRNGQELVEGVENIQFLYQSLAGGVFVDGSAGLPANLAAVQLGALVRSVSNETADREFGSGADLTEDTGQYTLLNQDVSGATGTIRGQRRVFNNTLAVRNRPL